MILTSPLCNGMAVCTWRLVMCTWRWVTWTDGHGNGHDPWRRVAWDPPQRVLGAEPIRVLPRAGIDIWPLGQLSGSLTCPPNYHHPNPPKQQHPPAPRNAYAEPRTEGRAQSAPYTMSFATSSPRAAWQYKPVKQQHEDGETNARHSACEASQEWNGT